MTDVRIPDWQFDLDTLRHVARVLDAEQWARCPTHMLPARIPIQRLSGLRRRGYLAYEDHAWWLTLRGMRYLQELTVRDEREGAES